MQQPAVAYHEHRVIAEVESICSELGLDCRADPHGNRIVTLNTAPHLPALGLVAHMDHPGFELTGRLTEGRWEAAFLGGVPDSYFQAGARLRAFPGNHPAVLAERIPGEGPRFAVELQLPPNAAPPEFAVWDLSPFAVGSGRIVARACDDLIGVACILATLGELKRQGSAVNVVGLITRAEEVGFHGSLVLAQSGLIPPATRILSLETSRELPPVQMGRGVVIRVGDRASIFDSGFTRFLNEVATSLQTRDPSFHFQRALMSGGTCEGTAFQEYGFQTAALCVALGNYHNCGAGDRVEEEYVSAEDATGMVSLLVEAARQMGDFGPLTGKLRSRLDQYTVAARQRLG